jgi:hypothetical protein
MRSTAPSDRTTSWAGEDEYAGDPNANIIYSLLLVMPKKIGQSKEVKLAATIFSSN